MKPHFPPALWQLVCLLCRLTILHLSINCCISLTPRVPQPPHCPSRQIPPHHSFSDHPQSMWVTHMLVYPDQISPELQISVYNCLHSISTLSQDTSKNKLRTSVQWMAPPSTDRSSQKPRCHFLLPWSAQAIHQWDSRCHCCYFSISSAFFHIHCYHPGRSRITSLLNTHYSDQPSFCPSSRLPLIHHRAPSVIFSETSDPIILLLVTLS